jgi:methyltransferase-like protein 23
LYVVENLDSLNEDLCMLDRIVGMDSEGKHRIEYALHLRIFVPHQFPERQKDFMLETGKVIQSKIPPQEELRSVQIGDQTLHIYVPDAVRMQEAWERNERGQQEAFPYWSKIWPSAMALCHWLKENPSLYAGKKVLEMGAGLGLPSLFVAMQADWVLCSDKDTEALAYAHASASHLRYQNVFFQQINWMDSPTLIDCNVLLLSDVNYEPAVFDRLRLLMQAYLWQGTHVVLATPQRLAAREFVSWLEPFVLSQTVGVADGQAVSIFHLSG